MRQVLIIGGGASGLTAAISAARAGAKVTLLEQNKQVGKKLLVTGNGRCNLTNRDQALSHYRGSSPAFIKSALKAFGLWETLEFFQGLGIVTRDRNGYLYPYSDQASAVADALRMEAEHQKVKLALNTRVQKIRKEKGRFFAETFGWTYEGDALILAAGSCAAAQTGSDGSGYVFAETMGHSLIKPLPALVQLRSKDPIFPKLKGLRTEAKVTLFSEKEPLAEDTGEVQFTEYGLSGIPVFQVSRYGVKALEQGKNLRAVLDLLPHMKKEELPSFWEDRIHAGAYKSAGQLLVGLFPKNMADCLLKRAEIPSNKTAGDLTREERKALLSACTSFEVKLSASNGFERAQVCCGGVDTREVNGKTMESVLVPKLYFAGELLDVDGACGGYNLQWAWTSGYLAGLYSAVDK
ncbi:NAD(P)/FAD-dependent oxidoreductase [Candidatus Merdisoma sp. JLR.KK006]|uniref:NAD(P)/FAD-dependent oxidoreductase n=1 Tax=Candidatus Merdisoma sp. JLR.KK006 TaxID=3112626 RepID=UPI002FF044D9